MNILSSISRRKLMAALAGGLALPQITGAQALAEGQVRLVVPFPPGGGTDAVGRLIGLKLGEVTGSTVVVDNRAGASGTIGIAAASKMPADGRSLVIGQADNMAVAPLLIKSVPYDPLTSLQPIAHIADIPILLVTAASQPYKSLADVVKAGKANPDLLTFGSAGVGTTPHLSGELFGQAAGITMRHIAYKGSAPALADVLAGRVPLMATSISLVVPHIKAGKLRPLAVTSLRRSAALPDVPTVAEAAGLAGFNVGTWYGLFAPAGVPRQTTIGLNANVNKVLDMPEVRAFIEGQEGGAIRRTTPEALGELLRSDIQRWQRIIRDAKVSLE